MLVQFFVNASDDSIEQVAVFLDLSQPMDDCIKECPQLSEIAPFLLSPKCEFKIQTSPTRFETLEKLKAFSEFFELAPGTGEPVLTIYAIRH